MRIVHTTVTRTSLAIILTCTIGTIIHRPAHAQIEPGRYLFTDDQGIVLQPPIRVSDDAMDLTWSPDSSRLVTFNSHIRPIDEGETEATSEFTIVRWVRGTHSASTLYSIRITGTMDLIMPPVWLPTTDVVIQDVAWDEKMPPVIVNGKNQRRIVSHRAYLWIDSRSGDVKSIDLNSRNLLTVSPSRPLAVVMYVARYGTADKPMLATIRMDGSTGKSFEFAGNERVGHCAWSRDGRRLTFSLITVDVDGKRVLSSVPSYYDPVTGEVGTLSAAPSHAPPATAHAWLHVSQAARQLTEVETSAKVRPLWVSSTIKSEHPRLLACADADLGVLSPNGAAVAYRSQGCAWVSDLKAIPLAQFKQMLIQAQREALLQKGKSLALATLMWAQDNNEVLPGSNNIGNITTYLGDPNDLSGFNLTFPGGPLSGITSPSETILGTIDGPGGQVIIYVDGHVRWQSN